jgi:hypothetical protein
MTTGSVGPFPTRPSVATIGVKHPAAKAAGAKRKRVKGIKEKG